MNFPLFDPPPEGVAPLQPRTKKDQLAQKLLEMIYQGLLRHNDTLPSERDLAAMFSVSRETVRAALASLAEQGLLAVSHGAKTRVLRSETQLQTCARLMPALHSLDIGRYAIEQVFETRQLIESHIVRLAAARVTPQDIEALQRMLDQQAQLFSEVIHFQLADKAFHQKLADIAGNPLLARYAEELYAYGLFFRRELLEGACLVEDSYREHQQIVAAIASGDGDQAAAAMVQHLDSVLALSAAER
ncbi:FadR/GntR family transcriptional regulator [Simiduia agarivorans]|uniref:GntR family transcriptional regulator n=1 Tax=Simiduia agarivorans (strain DSM 21679 / JCM 13881 / BCRC 17597 / SA1) TaxID=1117647 RepID=K4KRZ9_SIMAS|nr:FadR/GntR family transcriptional regulator [Simiduia agarivorans]AFV00939.1 GntR family transcriptional regulator [Simiduia agarivorans SA1 = DSM 21679]